MAGGSDPSPTAWCLSIGSVHDLPATITLDIRQSSCILPEFPDFVITTAKTVEFNLTKSSGQPRMGRRCSHHPVPGCSAHSLRRGETGKLRTLRCRIELHQAGHKFLPATGSNRIRAVDQEWEDRCIRYDRQAAPVAGPGDLEFPFRNDAGLRQALI